MLIPKFYPLMQPHKWQSMKFCFDLLCLLQRKPTLLQTKYSRNKFNVLIESVQNYCRDVLHFQNSVNANGNSEIFNSIVTIVMNCPQVAAVDMK